MLYDILLPIVLLTGNLKRMALLQLTHFIADAPVITLTSVSIQDASVKVDWIITTGDVYALQLRHHTYSQSQRLPSDIGEWSMAYDLNPDAGSEVIEGTFDTGVNNAFVLVVFEEDQLRNKGQYTAVSEEFIISSDSLRKYQG